MLIITVPLKSLTYQYINMKIIDNLAFFGAGSEVKREYDDDEGVCRQWSEYTTLDWDVPVLSIYLLYGSCHSHFLSVSLVVSVRIVIMRGLLTECTYLRNLCISRVIRSKLFSIYMYDETRAITWSTRSFFGEA